MKKICKCCGRNRRIGKFGTISKNPDGKNIYCRECMRKIRNGYACTIIGKRKTKEAKKRWEERNKNKRKRINREYYLRNREQILFQTMSRRSTECILITENSQKTGKQKINKTRSVCEIEINPQRK